MKEKKNQAQYPKRFYAKHFCSGVAGYLDENFLVTLESMKDMNNTFEGKPVFVGHRSDSQDKLDEADGYIVRSFYNKVDGWLWCEFLAITEEGQQAIAGGQAVSNAYVPVTTRGKGIYNGLEYDRELVEGVFTHLAIVPNPRYKESIILSPEDFKIYQESKRAELKQLENSAEENKTKKEKETIIMKFFKKEKKEIDNSEDILALSTVLESGKTITVAEMINEVEETRKAERLNAEAEKAKDEAKKTSMDAKVTVDGKEMTVKELTDSYISSNKKNAEAEEDEKAKADKEKADADKKNAEEADKAKADKKKDEDKKAEKENADHLKSLEEAGEKKNAISTEVNIQTASGAVELGKKNYGSSK